MLDHQALSVTSFSSFIGRVLLKSEHVIVAKKSVPSIDTGQLKDVHNTMELDPALKDLEISLRREGFDTECF